MTYNTNVIKKLALLISFSFGLVGCATAPQPHDFSNTQTYNGSFDQVWSNLIKYFAENDISIQTIDKNSGVVYAQMENLPLNNDAMDCGTPGMGVVESNIGSFNVFVVTNADHTVTATVNSKFAQNRANDFTSPPTEFQVNCASTGSLEQLILAQLGTPSSTQP